MKLLRKMWPFTDEDPAVAFLRTTTLAVILLGIVIGSLILALA